MSLGCAGLGDAKVTMLGDGHGKWRQEGQALMTTGATSCSRPGGWAASDRQGQPSPHPHAAALRGKESWTSLRRTLALFVSVFILATRCSIPRGLPTAPSIQTVLVHIRTAPLFLRATWAVRGSQEGLQPGAPMLGSHSLSAFKVALQGLAGRADTGPLPGFEPGPRAPLSPLRVLFCAALGFARWSLPPLLSCGFQPGPRTTQFALRVEGLLHHLRAHQHPQAPPHLLSLLLAAQEVITTPNFRQMQVVS